MSNIIFTPTYTQLSVKMPTFDFFIPRDNFYINTYGVSVMDITKSSTKLADGEISILNRNNKIIYFDSLSVTGVTIKKDSKTPRSSIIINKTKITETENKLVEEFTVTFKGTKIGLLLLQRDLLFKDGSNRVLYPFQSTKIQASYVVLNVNRVGIQYFGQSNTNPERKVGTLDINLSFNVRTNTTNTILISEPITLSVNLVNTGLEPQTFTETIEYNTGETIIDITVSDIPTTSQDQSITITT